MTSDGRTSDSLEGLTTLKLGRNRSVEKSGKRKRCSLPTSQLCKKRWVEELIVDGTASLIAGEQLLLE